MTEEGKKKEGTVVEAEPGIEAAEAAEVTAEETEIAQAAQPEKAKEAAAMEEAQPEETAETAAEPEAGEAIAAELAQPKSARGIKPLLAVCIALCIAYFAAMGVSMVMSAQAGGYMPSVGEAVMYFYQYNGLIVLAVLLFGIFALAGGKRKAVLVKTFAWGVLLTSVVMAAPVFAQLYILPQVDALQGFNFLVMYIPMLCVAVSFVALLTQWHSESRKTAGRVSLVCAAVAAAITVYYGVNVIDPTMQYELFQYLQLDGILCADALMVLVCVTVWYMGMKERAFCAAACNRPAVADEEESEAAVGEPETAA